MDESGKHDEETERPALEIFPWSKHFETGFAVIDRQHRKLASLLNRVASSAVHQSTDIDLDDLLNELSACARYHFEAEEILWARYVGGEKVLADHRKHHAGFVEKLQQLYQNKEHQHETLHESLSFLTHWLARHILQQDREMALIIEQVGQGVTLSAAQRDAERQLRKASPVILDMVLSMHKQLSEQTLKLIEERRARSQAEAELAAAMQRRAKDTYQAIFEASADGIVVFDVEAERVFDVNASACKLFNYAKQELLGRHVTELHPPELKGQIIRDFERFIQTESDFLLRETIIRRGDGTELPVEISGGNQISDSSGRYAVAIFRDISSHLEARRQLEYLAYHDPLTGLGNRTWIAEAIANCKNRLGDGMESLAVMTLDIDQFRRINDVHGQKFGDRLLIRLAQCWKQLLGSDAPLARIGGDEFVILLTGISERREAHHLVKRLMKLGENILSVDGQPLSISFSAGITYCDVNSAIEPEILLRQADQAMYQAKIKGRNRYEEFDSGRESVKQQQHETINALQAALPNNELTLHYQPKVNLRNGRVLGMEALIRWQHPERGLLEPSAFLPAVKSHPFSIQLGEWVIETALQQLRAWNEMDLDLPVSVNIGSQQLQHPELPKQVERLLAEYPEIDPASIEFEVLESGAIDDLRRAIKNLNAIRDLGVLVSIDDFGTGYSSLAYLKEIPADTVKIDRSFVHDILEEPDELPILLGIMTMADAFGMNVVAEGVETVEHGRLLLELGCEQAQGYSIARPMPSGRVPSWVKQWALDPDLIGVSPVLDRDIPALAAICSHNRWLNGLQTQESEPIRKQPARAECSCSLSGWLDSQRPQIPRQQADCFDDIQGLHTLLIKEINTLLEVNVAEMHAIQLERARAVNDELTEKLRTLLQARTRRTVRQFRAASN